MRVFWRKRREGLVVGESPVVVLRMSVATARDLDVALMCVLGVRWTPGLEPWGGGRLRGLHARLGDAIGVVEGGDAYVRLERAAREHLRERGLGS